MFVSSVIYEQRLNNEIMLSGEEKKVINSSTVISIKAKKGLKYSFGEKKQDGSVSKAYEGYQKCSYLDCVPLAFQSLMRARILRTQG